MANCKQDMPPPGGYGPIVYERVPCRAGLSLPVRVGVTLLMSGVGVYLLRLTKIKRSNEGIEMRCARSALQPMLLAEVDRMYLKQIRKNRDYEEKAMKGVEGWEVGKYKGQPVYLSLKPDEFFLASASEYYAHTEDKHKFFSFNIAKI